MRFETPQFLDGKPGTMAGSAVTNPAAGLPETHSGKPYYRTGTESVPLALPMA
jgi:hypothetical protein